VIGSEPAAAGFGIDASGVAVDPAVLASVLELIVDSRLRLPDRLVLRMHDDACKILDAGTFAVGASLVVRLAASVDTDRATVFDGQVTTVAPEFVGGATQLGVLALDRGARLQRGPRTAAYQDMSYGAIAASLATAAGLRPGPLAAGPTLPYVAQTNETDWDFLWRLAAEVDFHVRVDGRQLCFGPAGSGGSGPAVALALGTELRSFRPRITGVGQVDTVTVRGWDPLAAQAIVATASPGSPQSSPGASRDSVARALGPARSVVVDHPVLGVEHADVVARGLASRIADAFVEGEGSAAGNPLLTAGGLVDITGIGRAFSGVYALTGVRHVIRGTASYETRFYIAGREDRSLLGLARPASGGQSWQHRIVVGVVTNNHDPDRLGRVRVRYPALDDTAEGWWARVLTPGAGPDRGCAAFPLIGDEVLVAFEHGSEQHPYVLGSVFNGAARPGDLTSDDGSFLSSSVARMTFAAAGATAITTEDSLTLRAAGPATMTGRSGLRLDTPERMTVSGAGAIDIASDGQVTIQATSVAITASASVQISAPQVLLG
jgi:hypothetical protein